MHSANLAPSSLSADLPHSNVPHFQEQGRINPVSPSDRLSVEVYSTALDYLVIACVDLVLTHQDQVLLTQRDRPPRASWWIVGGRMAAGEAPVAAVLRKAAEEAQLSLTPDRCSYIGVYSTCFASRHQPPQQHGLHSVNLVYQIELTAAEQAAIALDPEEYSSWQWLDLQQISRLLDPQEAMDLALLNVMKDLERVRSLPSVG
ncbi:MAG TPA: NUDIX hydrolase [Coleofasciculaceae cyanobacterium]